MGPVDLRDLVLSLGALQKRPAELLVGFENNSDAAVFLLRDGLAIVQSIDFIGPVSNDPFVFGSAAAANALSDLYALGAKPLTALNVCIFPSAVSTEDLADILRGGVAKVEEAGATLVGGHTVRGKELQFGLSVTGLVDPGSVVLNSGAQTGDLLVLTKPIGAGAMISALRAGLVKESDLSLLYESMMRLNHRASELMVEMGAHSCTDVSGFGLAGHALEMARASGTTFRLKFREIPVFPAALDLIGRGTKTSITSENERAAEGSIVFDPALREDERKIVYDPQTSGGLLISLKPGQAFGLVDRLRGEGLYGWIIGEVLPRGGALIEIAGE